jgi:hypothetical protein
LKLRAEALQPIATRPAFVAAGALRHDALETQLAAGENTIAPSSATDALKWMLPTPATRRERVSPLLEGALAQIFALEVEKVESDI